MADDDDDNKQEWQLQFDVAMALLLARFRPPMKEALAMDLGDFDGVARKVIKQLRLFGWAFMKKPPEQPH